MSPISHRLTICSRRIPRRLVLAIGTLPVTWTRWSLAHLDQSFSLGGIVDGIHAMKVFVTALDEAV